jgi:hypothetical protein
MNLAHTWHMRKNNIEAADYACRVCIGVAWLLIERWTVVFPVMIEQGFDSISFKG